MLDVLASHLPIHRFIQLLVDLDQTGKILPASWCGEIFAVHRTFHLVEIGRPCVQIGNHGRVHTSCIGILSPRIKIRLHLDLFHTIHGHHIKFPDGFVVFRRISCSHDQPALRNLMASEGFALEKLQHGRGQRLGNAVDLINKKDSFS